jgi:hypothetical protein
MLYGLVQRFQPIILKHTFLGFSQLQGAQSCTEGERNPRPDTRV